MKLQRLFSALLAAGIVAFALSGTASAQTNSLFPGCVSLEPPGLELSGEVVPHCRLSAPQRIHR